MSITVNIYYHGKDGKAKAFAEEMESRGIVDRIREEDGNLRYEYWFSKTSPDTVLLIDEWKDQESIDRHHASEMMKEIIALREKYSLTMTVRRYVEDEIPNGDDKFIVKK